MNPTVTVQAIFVVTVPRCCIAQVMFYFVFFSTPGRRLLEICRRSTLSAGSAAGARAAGKAQTADQCLTSWAYHIRTELLVL
jgi:hypothetical protein